MIHPKASNSIHPSPRFGLLGTIIFAGTLCLGACGPAGSELDRGEEVDTTDQASTSAWIGPISEEAAVRSGDCRTATGDGNTIAHGAGCINSYCDNMYLDCTTPPAGVFPNTTAPLRATSFVSEENGSPAARCLPGTFITGLQATGRWSDNVSALCVPTTFDTTLWAPKGVLSNWSWWVSDEIGTTSWKYFNSGRAEFWGMNAEAFGVANAVRCSGEYCDNMSFFSSWAVNAYPTFQFSEQSNRGSTESGNWSPNDLIGECGHGFQYYMTGISVLTEMRPHRALCVGQSMRLDWAGGNWFNRLRSLSMANGDQRADTGTGDWDVGYTKAECARNEVMIGISQTTDRRLSKILCGPMHQNRSNINQCTPLQLSNLNDNRRNMLSGNWDPGYQKTECGLNQVMKGVSRHPTTGEIHRMLCCDQQPDTM